MSWDVVMLLVPLAAVPVLVWGFAGCGELLPVSADQPAVPGALPAPVAPTNLRAKATSTNTIMLSWEHASAGGIEFRIGRQRDNGTWDDDWGQAPGTTPRTFVDTVTDQNVHAYRVRALAAGTTLADASPPSNEVRTRVLVWETAYDKPLTTDGQGFAGDTLVQRIDKSLLTVVGKPQQMRLTLRGSTTAALALDQVYVSSAVPAAGIPTNPTPDPWDSALDLTAVHAGGTPLAIPAGAVVPLGPFAFVLNSAEDFVVACDISATAGAVRRREGDVGQSTCYVNADATEAAKADRLSLPNQWDVKPAATSRAVFLVEKIEVLTADPNE